MNARRFAALGLVLLGGMAAVPAAAAATPGSAIARWALFEGKLTHPAPPADALRGVELRTEFTAPDGQVTRFWGYYDGGATWGFRFSPDRIGRWRYAARFSDGAAEVSGEFACATSDLPGPLTRWRENPTWFATAAGGPVLVRSFHVGDRFFAENLEAATRTRFLDWAQAQGYNLLSIASHYLNRNAPGRGQGWRTPQLWDADARSVRPGEYAKAETILDELRARHFYVHPFAGFIGRHSAVPADPADQELYVRYTLARFAPFWNVLLNVAGPEPLWKPEGYENRMSFAEVNRIGELPDATPPAGCAHPGLGPPRLGVYETLAEMGVPTEVRTPRRSRPSRRRASRPSCATGTRSSSPASPASSTRRRARGRWAAHRSSPCWGPG